VLRSTNGSSSIAGHDHAELASVGDVYDVVHSSTRGEVGWGRNGAESGSSQDEEGCGEHGRKMFVKGGLESKAGSLRMGLHICCGPFIPQSQPSQCYLGAGRSPAAGRDGRNVSGRKDHSVPPVRSHPLPVTRDGPPLSDSSPALQSTSQVGSVVK
jgi:hypothetical protein